MQYSGRTVYYPSHIEFGQTISLPLQYSICIHPIDENCCASFPKLFHNKIAKSAGKQTGVLQCVHKTRSKTVPRGIAIRLASEHPLNNGSAYWLPQPNDPFNKQLSAVAAKLATRQPPPHSWLLCITRKQDIRPNNQQKDQKYVTVWMPTKHPYLGGRICAML